MFCGRAAPDFNSIYLYFCKSFWTCVNGSVICIPYLQEEFLERKVYQLHRSRKAGRSSVANGSAHEPRATELSYYSENTVKHYVQGSTTILNVDLCTLLGKAISKAYFVIGTRR